MTKLTQFESGAVRDSAEGKADYTLIDARYYRAGIARTYAVLSSRDGLFSYIYDIDKANAWTVYNTLRVSREAIAVEYPSDTSGGLTGLPYAAITRFAARLTDGAAKYGRFNWQLGMDIDRTRQSLFRHLWQWNAVRTGQLTDNEDHFAATLCNLMFLWYDLSKLENKD